MYFGYKCQHQPHSAHMKLLNFHKLPQEKKEKPRSSIELKKSNNTIRLFLGQLHEFDIKQFDISISNKSF